MKVYIKGLHCEHCVKTVKRLLLKIKGVQNVEIDLKSSTATIVTSRRITKENFEIALKDTPYEVEQFQ